MEYEVFVYDGAIDGFIDQSGRFEFNVYEDGTLKVHFTAVNDENQAHNPPPPSTTEAPELRNYNEGDGDSRTDQHQQPVTSDALNSGRSNPVDTESHSGIHAQRDAPAMEVEAEADDEEEVEGDDDVDDPIITVIRLPTEYTYFFFDGRVALDLYETRANIQVYSCQFKAARFSQGGGAQVVGCAARISSRNRAVGRWLQLRDDAHEEGAFQLATRDPPTAAADIFTPSASYGIHTTEAQLFPLTVGTYHLRGAAIAENGHLYESLVTLDMLPGGELRGQSRELLFPQVGPLACMLFAKCRGSILIVALLHDAMPLVVRYRGHVDAQWL